MHLTGLDLLFWAAGLGTHLILLGVLLLRGRYKTFPIFTTFVLTSVGRTAILYSVERYGTKASYFYSYWSLAISDVCMQLAVVYEMYSLTFRPLGKWARDLHGAFVWLVGASIAIAAALTWLATPHTRLLMQLVVIKGSFFSSTCMSELFVGMIALSVRSGLPWKTHVARISQGLGVYSILDVLIEAGHSYFGVGRDTHLYTNLSHFRMTIYLVCVVYWILMLSLKAPDPRPLPDSLRMRLTDLQSQLNLDLEKVRAGRCS